MLDYRALAEGAAEQREPIDDTTVDQDLTEQLMNIKTAIAALREILFFKGMVAGDVFYKVAQETRFTPDETSLTPRVRWDERYGTPSFSWERTHRRAYPLGPESQINDVNGKGRSYVAKVRRKKSGLTEKMKIVLISEHINVNSTTHRVSDKNFFKEPEWAQISASIVEEQFCELRKLNRSLATISKALTHAQSLHIKNAKEA